MSDGPRMISIEKIESDSSYHRTQLPKRKALRNPSEVEGFTASIRLQGRHPSQMPPCLRP